MSNRVLRTIFVLFLSATAASAVSQGIRPLGEEAAYFYRLSLLNGPENRFYDLPWFEEELLGAERPSEEDRVFRDVRSYLADPRRRHLLRIRTPKTTVLTDGTVSASVIGRRADGRTERLWIGTGGAAVGAELGRGWAFLVLLTSRFELGDVGISPFTTETDTTEGIYETFRAPSRVETYVTWRNDWLRFSAGRQRAKWGPGIHSSLLLSDHSRPKPMVRFRATLGWLRFSALAATLLGPDIDGHRRVAKYFAAHRVEIAPMDWFGLAVSESVVFGERFEPRYLNPIDVYYLDVDATTPNNRNIGLEGNLYIAKRLHLYGELYVDDFQPQEGARALRAWATKGGILLGFLWRLPFELTNTSLAGEFVFVNEYAYTHLFESARYTDGTALLGFRPGPDAESLWLRAVHYVTPRLRFEAEWERLRRGEGRVDRDRFPPRGEEWDYLSGVVETTRTATFRGIYRVLGGLSIRGRVTWTRIVNVENRPGERRSYVEGAVEVGYRLP